MDRTFLYSVVVFLTVALGGVYIQKSNPEFFSGLVDRFQGSSEPWIEKDPGWDRNQPMPKSDPNAVPPTNPTTPPASPIPPPDNNDVSPPPPPSDPSPDHPDRRFPRLRPNRPSPGCPGCR